MEKVLIINDRGDLAQPIARIVKELGGEPSVVLGDDSTILKPKIGTLLKKPLGSVSSETNFKGTILDILFQNEPDGGIRLWESLTSAERTRAGKLIVVTNEDNPEVQEFCAKYAAGRCFAFTTPRLKDLIKLNLF